MQDELKRGPLTGSCVHLCVDMQNLFAQETGWQMPWMKRVLPHAVPIARAGPHHTIFTRFIPAQHPGQGEGTWKHYYERWASMTLDSLPAGMTELVPELAPFVPPGEIIEKTVYSPWFQPELADSLKRRGADALIVTGGETDVCVLATVLGAIDRGYRVIVAKDCLCSSSDEAHEASIKLYLQRYGQQVEVASAETILANWNLGAEAP